MQQVKYRRVHGGKIDQPIFTAREETEMVQCAAERAMMGISLSKPNFLRISGVIAKSKGILLRQG